MAPGHRPTNFAQHHCRGTISRTMKALLRLTSRFQKQCFLIGVGLALLTAVQFNSGWHMFNHDMAKRKITSANDIEAQNVPNFRNDDRDVPERINSSSGERFSARIMPDRSPNAGLLLHGLSNGHRFTEDKLLPRSDFRRSSFPTSPSNSNTQINANLRNVLEAPRINASDRNISRHYLDAGTSLELSEEVQRRVTEDAIIRKNIFLSRNNNCISSKSSTPLPLGQSCVLKLKVNKVAESSRDFDYLNNKLHEEWKRQAAGQHYELSAPKLVLFWNTENRFTHPRECPICELSINKSLSNRDAVDAIVVSSFAVKKEGEGAILPSREMFPNAKMIAYEYEPTQRSATDLLEGFVDFTFGYRKDSDMVKSNGYVQPLQSPRDISDILAKNAQKTKMVAWLVSNCKAPSKRLQLAKTLEENGVDIDIYGHCGTLTCPKGDHTCSEMLSKKYKFYLSFENTLCNHYVTEKFYRPLRFNIVPITYGLGHEFTGVPPDSYIDVFDFVDVKSLAEYILYLDSNITAYNEYFKWLAYYEINLLTRHNSRLCQLCEKLISNSPPAHTFKNGEYGLWVKEGQCIDVANGTRIWNFVHGLPQK